MDPTSAELLANFRRGDPKAADEIFRRFVSRRPVLARSRLSPRLSRRVDAEDVVQSAYRSFFLRARDGQFTLTRSGDLWRLLVAITLRKVYRQAARHRSEKRSIDKERELSGDEVWGEIEPHVARQPSPEEALAAAEELELVMSQLPSLERRILEMRLQDKRLDEIAADTGRSERTIRRLLDGLEQKLRERWRMSE